MLMEKTLRTCVQYLTAAFREDYKEQRSKTYHRLVLRINIWTAVRWLTDNETGGVL